MEAHWRRLREIADAEQSEWLRTVVENLPFAKDIERFLNHDAVAAGPPTVRYKLQKFVRRNKGLLSATALVAIVLLVGTGVSIWQAVRATVAERDNGSDLRRAGGTKGGYRADGGRSCRGGRDDFAELVARLGQNAEARGRGYARAVVASATAFVGLWLWAPFALVLCAADASAFYEHLGWRKLNEAISCDGPLVRRSLTDRLAMVLPCQDEAEWPSGPIDLCGPPW